MGKNRSRGRNPQGNGPSPHQKFEQQQGQIESRQGIYESFTEAVANSKKGIAEAPIADTVQKRLILAIDAGHIARVCEKTGMTESRIDKIAKGTQAAQGDKLGRLKDVLTAIENESKAPEADIDQVDVEAESPQYEMA